MSFKIAKYLPANKKTKLVSILIKKKLTIASVESITAGLFASTLAEVPGASRMLRGALVTYQASVKVSLLKIRKSYIHDNGVVSQKVACAMARRAKELINADIIVSFTGNAGPTKEPGGAEVGRVYSAIFYNNKIYDFTKIYKGNRNKIRKAVVNDAFTNILKILEDK